MTNNLIKTKIYICPICNNFIISPNDIDVCCCSKKLVEAKFTNVENQNNICDFDGNINFKINCKMTKQDYITFVAYVTDNRISIIKLFPEQDCEVNFERNGNGYIYYHHNINGLFRIKI